MLNYNLGKTGFISALPYLAMAIMIQFSGHIADWMIKNTRLTVTHVRKIFNTSGFVFHIAFMLGAAFWLEEAGTIFCLVMAIGVGVIAWSGFGYVFQSILTLVTIIFYSVNYLDIAPQHASVLMGVSNTFATLAGIMTPIVSGYIVVTPVMLSSNST